jgi:aspartate-semialdehyde dehydrogenase
MNNRSNSLKVAVVGVTGMVGRVMLKVLEERNFPVGELIPVASERSAGGELVFRKNRYRIMDLNEAITHSPDIALFSAGGSVSREWAPRFAAAGCYVIDNSSAWRMEKDIPLIIPEINAEVIRSSDKIIANPNCSTIQMLMVLAPLHREYGIRRVVVSTYQSVTGTGKEAVSQLEDEEHRSADIKRIYPHPIYRNVLPHCDVFLENGYTKEEMKLVNETRKILGEPELPVTATAVRVPVTGGHSESINVSLHKEFDLKSVRDILSATPGVILQDSPEKNLYPMPYLSEGKDEVFVGRIRRDESFPNTLNLWVVADNLRKGAATNAVQIAEYLLHSYKGS